MGSFRQDKESDRLNRICLSKVAHRVRIAADYALDEMHRLPHSAKLHIYTCPVCGLFHIGKTSDYFLSKQKEDEYNTKNILPDNSRNVVSDTDIPGIIS